jgi:hypothetical protein
MISLCLLFASSVNATSLNPHSTSGGNQILGGNYHAQEDIFEPGVRCIEVDEFRQTQVIRDENATVSTVTVMDFKSLKKELGLGVSIGSNGWLVGENNFKIAFDFLKTAKETDSSIVFIYRTKLDAGEEILKGPFRLTREAKDTLDLGMDEFKRLCGDQFVYKISKGARAFVAVKIDLGSKQNKKKVQNEFKLGFTDILALSATLKKLKEELGVSSTVTISGYQEGGFAARINGIFGNGKGVSSCSTTDSKDCEVTIKEVLNYFSKDFSNQFDHYYRDEQGSGVIMLPPTSKIMSYNTRSYCKLSPGERMSLDCPRINIDEYLDILVSERSKFEKKLRELSGVLTDPNLVLHPDYEKKLKVLKDTLISNLNLIAEARVTCIKDEWSCKSVMSKTNEKLYQLDEDPTEEIRLEDRIEFCFNTGLNSMSGKIEWSLMKDKNVLKSFSIDDNPRMGVKTCYAFEAKDIGDVFNRLDMRVQAKSWVDPKCEKKRNNKYLSVMNWELVNVVVTNLATGYTKSFDGRYFYKKSKCTKQEKSRPHSKWATLNPL